MSHNRAHSRETGQPSDQVTKVVRERRRPPGTGGHVATKALKIEAQSDIESRTNHAANTILSGRPQTNHPKTHSQACRGLPDGERQNSHHGRPRRLPRDRRAHHRYTLICEEPVSSQDSDPQVTSETDLPGSRSAGSSFRFLGRDRRLSGKVRGGLPGPAASPWGTRIRVW